MDYCLPPDISMEEKLRLTFPDNPENDPSIPYSGSPDHDDDDDGKLYHTPWPKGKVQQKRITMQWWCQSLGEQLLYLNQGTPIGGPHDKLYGRLMLDYWWPTIYKEVDQSSLVGLKSSWANSCKAEANQDNSSPQEDGNGPHQSIPQEQAGPHARLGDAGLLHQVAQGNPPQGCNGKVSGTTTTDCDFNMGTSSGATQQSRS